MFVLKIFFLVAVLASAITGCAAQQSHMTKDITLPEPRLPGKEFKSYKAPSKKSGKLPQPQFGTEIRIGRTSLQSARRVEAKDGRKSNELPPNAQENFTKKTRCCKIVIQPADTSVANEFAEPTGNITLRQALSIALAKNPELAAFSREVRASEARTLQAGLLPNPEIDIYSENSLGTGPYNEFDRTESTIELSQLIQLAGKRFKRTRVAALKKNLSEWDYESKRLDVLTETTVAFIDVLTAQERLSLSKELTNLAEQVHNTVSERVKAGKVSPVEETKAKIALSMSRIELEHAKRTLKAERKRLASFWDSDSPVFEKVKGNLNDVTSIPSLEQLINRISQNPDIARWVVEMEQRRAAIELADSKKIPDLTLRGGIRRLNETKDNAFILGISIPIPVFNYNQGGYLEARHKLAKTEKEQKATEIKVRTLLAEAYQNLSTAFVEAITLKNEILPGSQSAFDATNEGYLFGKFNFLDVLDAQRTLFDVKGRYIKTLSDYHKAVANVERLIGTPLKEILKETDRKLKEKYDEK